MSQSIEQTSEGLDVRRFTEQLLRYVHATWLRRWVALGVAWLVAIVAVLLIYALPNRFQATAQVFVDTDNVLRPLLKGLSVESDVMSDVGVMSRTLVTRPNLERVARETDLDIGTTNKVEYEALLASLEQRIQITGSRENIYTITFEDTDRALAVNVVNKLLDSFVEDTLGTGHEDSAHAQQTLSVEIKDYERRLIDAEDRLKEFKRKNVGLMPNEHGDYYNQLQKATADLDATRRRVRMAQEKLQTLKNQLEGEEPVFGIMSTSPIGGAGSTPMDMEISSLESKVSSLLVEFTDKHPEVQRARSRLNELYAQREKFRQGNPQSSMPSSANPLDLNPVYQNLKIQQSKVEVELSSLRALASEQEREVKRLKESVDVIPQVEAELNRLNRDYDVVKSRYTEMLRRWEDLQTAERVNTGTDHVRFKIINPPFSPLRPVGPPRALYLTVVSLASIGAGVAVAFLLSQLQPIFRSTRDVAQLGFPVLGSISMRRDAATTRRERFRDWVLAGAFAALILYMAVVTAFADIGSRLLHTLI